MHCSYILSLLRSDIVPEMHNTFVFYQADFFDIDGELEFILDYICIIVTLLTSCSSFPNFSSIVLKLSLKVEINLHLFSDVIYTGYKIKPFN